MSLAADITQQYTRTHISMSEFPPSSMLLVEAGQMPAAAQQHMNRFNSAMSPAKKTSYKRQASALHEQQRAKWREGNHTP
jgi:hypothetical protein